MLRRVPAKIWLRLLVLLGLLVGGFLILRFTPLAGLIEQDRLIAWLNRARSNPLAPLYFLALFVLVSLTGAPITPMILAGGAVFGFLGGALLNFVGIFLGASATYIVGRMFGYELAARLLGARHRKLERFLGRRGFWSLVRLRYVPLPFFVANFGAALAGVRYPMFASSTALAFVPWMLLWSYFASALVEIGGSERAAVVRNLVIAAVLLITASFVPPRLTALARKRRYRRLLEARARRPSTTG